MSMSFDLPPLDGTGSPAFTTGADGKLWLGNQTLTNPANLQRQLCEQIEMLNRQPIGLRQRFDILELLYSHITFAQEEMSKRYMGKPLPHLTAEADVFALTIRLWQAATLGYLRCLEDADAGKASGRTLATLVQCALSSLHAMQADCTRGYAQLETRHWARLHQLLAYAEDHHIATVSVIDEARYGTLTVTPLSVYVEAMLLHAVSATEFSTRSLHRVVRWARKWSTTVTLLTEAPADLQAVPINVDLDSSLPPSAVPIKNAGRARYLDTAGIASNIKACLAGLAAGSSPAELGLGDDCSSAACEVMLQRLYQCWCRGGMQRPADRNAVTGMVDLAAGAEAIWFHLAGRPFKQPRASDEMLRREREEIATFGQVSGRADAQTFDKSKLRAESGWQIVNESPGGVRLMRALDAQSIRIGVGHLLAIKKPQATSFMLASVRWLVLDPEGRLHAGLQLIPGVATPIAFRIAGLNAANETWRPAFLLLADQPHTQVQMQMVLPPVVFRTNRSLEIEGGPVKSYKLKKLVERSDDFERALVE
jgi:hypothetical protein